MHASTSFAVSVVLFGMGLRQIDRLWYAAGTATTTRGGQRAADVAAQLRRHQRRRANNVTPVLVMAGHWVEIAGWWALLPRLGWLGAAMLTLVISLKFRHLQELTHYAVHGALAKSRRLGDLLAEVFYQAPLAMVALPVRRRNHVVLHHPNAARAGLDPNAAEIAAAGITEGCGRRRFLLGAIWPVTPAGLLVTLRARKAGVLSGPLRLVAPFALMLLAFQVSGSAALIWGVVVPLLVVYPQLAWLAMLIEHRWFAPQEQRPTRIANEAQRCLRLYQRRPILTAIARLTWLPYGDVFHFAHSAFPNLRWNYLAAVDRLAAGAIAGYPSMLLGRHSAMNSLFSSTKATKTTKTTKTTKSTQKLIPSTLERV